jgi:single-strand DNA-binding protein
MASFNKVILMGNLTRDPQVRYITSGNAVTELGIAVSRQWYDKQSNTKKEETTFVDVTLWGRLAEIAGEYLAKGRPVLIEGRLQLDTWDDKETGQKRSKMRVVGETMQLLGSRGDGPPGGGGGGANRGQAGGGRGRSGGDSYSDDASGGGFGGPSNSAEFGGDSFAVGGGPADDDVPF